MAPTIKVQQIILPNVVDDVNFIRVPKMDRCQTCHLAIDKKGYEKYPQPFTTHPDLATYLGGSSPHPIDKTGCTVCHEGHGAVGQLPRRASHTPSKGEKQKEEWEKKYHWEEPHEWDYPMLPVKMTEASCAKCHKQQVYVPKADELNVAYATYERAGCYACHKTKGFDTNIRKPGPILTKIDSKLTQDWVKNWIRNPRAVKPTTWMPRFFYNSNNSSPEDAVRNEVEINGIVAYLFANAEKYESAVKNPPHGDAKRRREDRQVRSAARAATSSAKDRARASGPRRTFGQPLENIGNKTTYEWIYNWVRDPKHYSPATYMPNLRLTDAQVADVATYLDRPQGTGGRSGRRRRRTQKATDDVLLDYLKAVLPFEDAKAAAREDERRSRSRSSSDSARSAATAASAATTSRASRRRSRSAPTCRKRAASWSRGSTSRSSTDIPHTSKLGWFRTKLHDPRIFDKGRVLQPLDKLRMPNFDSQRRRESSGC